MRQGFFDILKSLRRSAGNGTAGAVAGFIEPGPASLRPATMGPKPRLRTGQPFGARGRNATHALQSNRGQSCLIVVNRRSSFQISIQAGGKAEMVWNTDEGEE